MKRRRPATLEPIAASAFVIISLHVAVTAALVWWWQGQQARQSRAPVPLVWVAPGDFKPGLPSTSQPKARKTPESAAKSKVKPAAPPPPAPQAPAEPPVQKATLVAAPPDQHRMEPAPNEGSTPLFAPASPVPKPSANRSITLRRMRSKPAVPAAGKSPAPPMSSPTLLDIARLNAMRPSAPPKPGASVPVDDIDNITELDPVDESINTAFLGVWTAPPIDAVPLAQREARLNISVGRDGTILKSQMSKFSGSHVLDQSILEAAANVRKIFVTLPENYTKDSYDVELNFLLLP